MVEIARATVGKPRLMMMDEPGAGLAEDESDHLRQVIKAIHDFAARRCCSSTTTSISSQATCSATLVLDFGSRIAYGPTAQALADPKVRAAYLGVVEEAA